MDTTAVTTLMTLFCMILAGGNAYMAVHHVLTYLDTKEVKAKHGAAMHSAMAVFMLCLVMMLLCSNITSYMIRTARL